VTVHPDSEYPTCDELWKLSKQIEEHGTDGTTLLTLGMLRRVPNLHVSFMEFLTTHQDREDSTLIILDSRGPRVQEVN